MASIIELILAIPKIYSMIKEIMTWFSKEKAKQVENAHDKARSEMDLAKTEQEIKDANKKLADNP